MTRKAKMTNPVVTMDEHQSLFVDGRRVGLISNITFVSEAATELRAIADFLDQLEGVDTLSQVTP